MDFYTLFSLLYLLRVPFCVIVWDEAKDSNERELIFDLHIMVMEISCRGWKDD